MPVEDPVSSGDQVRHDGRELSAFLNCDVVSCAGMTEGRATAGRSKRLPTLLPDVATDYLNFEFFISEN
jgi:hypothetical protein